MLHGLLEEAHGLLEQLRGPLERVQSLPNVLHGLLEQAHGLLEQAHGHGKKSYIIDDSTPVANTTILGLPVNTVVGFEIAVKTSAGVGKWSQTLDVFVR